LGMAEMPDDFIDLAIIDAPYGIGENRGQEKSRNINRVDRRNGKPIIINHPGYKIKSWDLKKPDKVFFDEVFRISKNQIIWGWNNYNQVHGAGRIFWDKCNGKSDFSDGEIAFCSLHESIRLFRFMWSGFCQGRGILEGHINQGNKTKCEKRIHPTQKPVALYKWLLSNYAKPGDLILDTHMGSGSSYIACLDMGFDYIGFEIDADYFKGIEDRVYHFTRQRSLL